MDINLFPDEILTEIFKKVTTKERNPIRMTCRRWMVCCNQLEILKIEQFQFPHTSPLDDTFSKLLTFERSVMNLKFSNHQLESPKFQQFWQRCGQKVVHLELEECFSSPSSLEDILINCTKLSYLALRNVEILEDESTGPSSRILVELNSRKVVASSVKTLILVIRGDLGLEELLSVVSIFPNLRNLILNTSKVKKVDIFKRLMSALFLHEKNHVEYSCDKYIQCLATKLQLLENLSWKTLSLMCKCEEHIQKTKFSRLKTFRFHNDLTPRRVEENETYFPRAYTLITSSNSKYLTSIEFFYDAKAEDIINVLQQLPWLQKIHVVLKSVINLSDFTELYKALANSKLVSINIQNELKPEWVQLIVQMLQDRSLPVNYTVRDLKIVNLTEEADIFVSVFLKCFSATNRLRLRIISEIFNVGCVFFQTNLKCIELKTNTPCINVYTSSVIESIASDVLVENLEYLRIDAGNLKSLLLKYPSIFFSNLRYLYITRPLNRPLFLEQLPLSLWELDCIPLYNLEEVYMSVDNRFQDIFTFFSEPISFPKIQRIIIKIPSTEVATYKQKFESWFKHCPCLESISMILEGKEMCSNLYYDPIRQEIRECTRKQTTDDSFGWKVRIREGGF